MANEQAPNSAIKKATGTLGFGVLTEPCLGTVPTKFFPLIMPPRCDFLLMKNETIDGTARPRVPPRFPLYETKGAVCALPASFTCAIRQFCICWSFHCLQGVQRNGKLAGV